jgi:single-stranded DNA-binding protein
MINAHVTLCGRIANPGGLKSIGDHVKLGFRMAVDRRTKIGDEWKNVPTWWTVEIWGRDAEYLATRIASGAQVTVMGEPYSEEWTTREGEKRTDLRVRAHAVLMVRTAADAPPAPAPASDPRAPPSPKPAAAGDGETPF